MKSGCTYEVFVDGKPVGLVGSTICTLIRRRVNGYTKRFGQSVELRLIRKIPIPVGYSEHDYNFYLKACEALDIARKGYWWDQDGLNKISPLIQALGQNILESERGRIGGRIGGKIVGRMAKEQGTGIFALTHEQRQEVGRIAGNKTKENKTGIFAPENHGKGGRIGGPIGARNRNNLHGNPATPESCSKAGRVGILKMTFEFRSQGGAVGGHASAPRRKAEKSGIFAPGISAKGNRIANCKRWSINRGKSCVCGEHSDFSSQR